MNRSGNNLRLTGILITMMLLPLVGWSQQSVGINTSTPNPNAVLHLVSPNNNQGFQIPALTSSQRLAMSLSTADEGLMVYDREEGAFYYWHNNTWASLNQAVVDNDPENELQTLSLEGGSLTISDGNSIDVSNWDLNASDDFDGNYSSLVGTPSIPTKTSDLTNDAGFITNANDADASATNEIQDLQYSANQLSLTNDPDNTIVDFSTWDQNASDDFDGNYGSLVGAPDFTGWDTNAADDFDGAYSSLTGAPTIPTKTSDLANDSGFITSANDADANSTNEIQDLQYSASQLSLTNDPDNTIVDFTSWDQNASDDFDGNYSSLVGAPDFTGWDTNAADDFDGAYSSLTGAPSIPTKTSDLTNDAGFITSANDADANSTNEIQDLQYSASQLSLTNDPDNTIVDFSAWDQNASDDFDGAYSSLTGAPTIPTKTSDLTNDTGFITSANDADANPTNEIQDLQYNASQLSLTNDPDNTIVDFSAWDQNASDDFDGNYSSLVGTPSIPTKTSDLANDSGFITSANDADASATNEIQDLQYSASQLSLTNDPDNTIVDFSAWDQNASDDFDGNYSSLTGAPTIPTKTSDLTNDAGFITSANDADASTTNEIQDLQYSASQLSLTNDPDNTIVDFSSWDQNASDDFDGNYGSLLGAPDFTGWDTNAADDFDGAYSSLTGAPTIPTKTSDLTNDAGFITSANDADASATNEIQDLQYSANQLSLTNDPDNTIVDFSAWDQNASDDFDGNYSSLVGTPSIPTKTSDLTNDAGFITSANDADASATNEIQDLQYSASQLSLTNDPDNTIVDFSSWDQNASDDFDGNYGSLVGAPDFTGWDTNAADDFDGAYSSLTGAPTIPTKTSDLTNDAGFITSANDADASATNEIQDLQYSASQLSLTNDPDNTIVDFSAWDQNASDDFDGNYSSLVGAPDFTGWDTNAADDFDGAYSSLTGAPTIPTKTSDLTNDAGFITSANDADASTTNEIQDLQYSASQLSLTNDPDNTIVDFSAWDQNASDDFDGNYSSLVGTPSIPTKTSDLANDAGFITSANDADASATNEIQDLQYSASQLSLTNDPDNTIVDFSSWDQNASDDFDGNYSSLVGTPSIPTKTSDLTNDTGFITSANDADASATNEIQDLQYSASQLSLTNDPDNTIVDFSSWDQNASDDFDGNYSSLVGAPTIPTKTSDLTNDAGFITSVNDADASATNEIQDLQYSASQLSLTNDPDNTIVDFSAWDQNASDDFDGNYSSLVGAPDFTGWDTNAADDFDGAYSSLTGAPTLGSLAAKNTVATADVDNLAITPGKMADVVTANTYNIVLGGSITYNSKGQITSTGTSDQRLKKDTVRIGNALSRLRQVKGYTYYWKDESLPGIQYGFMAQQLETAFPDLVMTNAEGTKSVNYTGVIPVLVEALKEQAQQIDDLRAELNESRQLANGYEARLQKVEALLEVLASQSAEIK
ncbi:tail fiber domain-containing protein [Marinoscillum furvescens]|uniref:Adhesin HecA-like repeat protein n=1 Tax=Marinoscillum furvescens DSM 4134 TaxID=1122208 RepID=A0A3D9L1Q0_MARFU|nr:tail fiber domain-containing protein [Marinoscillum furvescens]RED97027.1 adhesin HecA-like repeat protein [Marinoscillum furvescens DSM 4134]